MTDPKKIALIGAGLVGLYLLSGRAEDAAGGGGFGGGDGEPLGDGVAITFPELDLSQIWGDVETKKDVSDPGVEYFQYLKDIGERPTMGEEGDIMALSEFDISQYRTTTKKLPSEPDQKMFTVPFFGATGAPTFSSWLKTHNIFGKRIAGATAPPPSLVSKKDSGISAAVRKYRYPTLDLRTGKKTTVDAFTGVSPTKGYVGSPR